MAVWMMPSLREVDAGIVFGYYGAAAWSSGSSSGS